MTKGGHKRTLVGTFFLVNALFLWIHGRWHTAAAFLFQHGTNTGMLLSWSFSFSFLMLEILIFFGCFFGVNAPDWMEIHLGWGQPNAKGFSKMYSVIPHRTWTHWWPFWILSLWLWIFLSTYQNPVLIDGLPVMYRGFSVFFWMSAFFLGFTVGGIVHLMVDIPNPMGIPIRCPMGKCRFSLRLWKSGEHEVIIPLVLMLVGFLCLILLFV